MSQRILFVILLLFHGYTSTINVDTNKNKKIKFTIDPNNDYKTKFNNISKDKHFFKSIEKINDDKNSKKSKLIYLL